MKRGRLLARAVMQLVAVIERDRQQAARPPLEGNRPVCGIDGGAAATGNDEDHFITQLAHRIAVLAGSDLPYIHAGERFRADDVVERCGDAPLVPRLDRDLRKRAGGIAAMKVEAQIVFNPLFIGGATIPGNAHTCVDRRHQLSILRQAIAPPYWGTRLRNLSFPAHLCAISCASAGSTALTFGK